MYELPSEPAIVTFEAFVALTVKVDAAPEVTVVGLAEMLTVGVALVSLPLTPPHPASINAAVSPKNSRETRRRTL